MFLYEHGFAINILHIISTWMDYRKSESFMRVRSVVNEEYFYNCKQNERLSI